VNIFQCDDDAEGRPATTSPSPSVVPSRPDPSKEPPPVTKTGKPGRAAEPTSSARPSPPAPQPTPTFDEQKFTESGQTFEAYDWPTFIALYKYRAKQVAEKDMADLQVEASQLSPLHGAKAAKSGPEGICGGAAQLLRRRFQYPGSARDLCALPARHRLPHRDQSHQRLRATAAALRHHGLQALRRDKRMGGPDRPAHSSLIRSQQDQMHAHAANRSLSSVRITLGSPHGCSKLSANCSPAAPCC
jgi:hypothetical protein